MIEATGAAQSGVNLQASLDDLVGIAADGTKTRGQFTEAFRTLFEALKHDRIKNPLGLPTVLLSRLSPDLVQVLLFWLSHTKQRPDENDNHPFRFVIFWNLCVRFDDKASNLCFRLIRETEPCSLKALFRAIRSVEWLSRDLVSPDKMTYILTSKDPRPQWRTLRDRQGKQDQMVSELVDRWWHDRANVLPWLQRNYLASAFPGYDPTADRDDDTPYDVDHMVPGNDWGEDWRYLSERLKNTSLTPPELLIFRNFRGEVGNSIGNKWLVDYSTNRSWGDTSFQSKLQHIQGETADAPRRLLEVFQEEVRAKWIQASPENTGLLPWTDERLKNFQDAVEHRAAWLYKTLYEDLVFSSWEHSTPSPA